MKHDVKHGWCICGERHGSKNPAVRPSILSGRSLEVQPRRREKETVAPPHRHDFERSADFPCEKVCECGQRQRLQHRNEKCFHKKPEVRLKFPFGLPRI